LQAFWQALITFAGWASPFLAAEFNANAAMKSFVSTLLDKGASYAAVIQGLIDNAATIFPDPVTRPTAVTLLQWLLKLAGTEPAEAHVAVAALMHFADAQP
jgi:hypothetical protein